MKRIFLVLIFILSCYIFTVNSQTSSFLNNLTPLLKITRLFMSELVRPQTFNAGYQASKKINKVQPKFIGEFFCDVNGAGRRSKTTPTSVHKLTPGDIDIVAALGDSLTAANGAFAVDSLQTTLEGRGVSWSIGGRENWRTFLTLPNIIKEFNPKLYGYSEAANSLGFQKAAKFNVAEPGAILIHTIQQAKNLVKRMRTDSRVDLKNHWKLITIMIGSNDFCLDVCYYENEYKLIEDAESNMIHVLRILRENLPRTLINVVIPVDVSILYTLKNTPKICQGFHYLECPCLVSLNQSRKLKRTLKVIKMWKEMVVRVVDRMEFHKRDDFEINSIMFTKNLEMPLTKDNLTDFSLISYDCFHLSQKGHSFFAMNLWNQMLTQEDRRISYTIFDYNNFKCPTENHPYIRTRKN